MMRCLITGGNGFVGRALTSHLLASGCEVRLSLRQPLRPDQIVGVETVEIGSLSLKNDWTAALRDVDRIVHLAARVHVMNDKSTDPLAEFRQVNVEGTANLARQAAAAGVRRFVYLSSIKVNGEGTLPGRPFTAEDAPAPEDAYGISKAEAETELRRIAQETGMEVTIIRPPLIYGPGVKGNFSSLINWVRRGLPLPLGNVTHNRRSLVGLDNLVDLIWVCVEHPKAANQTFLISDEEDLSTTELLRKIGKALSRPARLLWVPAGLIAFIANMLGRSYADVFCAIRPIHPKVDLGLH